MLTVTKTFDAATGALTISSDGGDTIEVGSDAGWVTVNGFRMNADPYPLWLPANEVRQLTVSGGPASNEIRVALDRSEYTRLAEPVRVSGGDGDDRLSREVPTTEYWRHPGGSFNLAIEFYGGRGNDYIACHPDGDTKVYGEDGDDVMVIPKSYHDRFPSLLDGGAGTDQFVVVEVFVASWQKLSDTEWLTNCHRSPGGTVLANIERADLGSYHDVADDGSCQRNSIDASGFSGNAVLRGTKCNDSLTGGSGNDVLIGDDGDDVLDGGRGSDQLEGGPDVDWYLYHDAGGQPETDTLVESGSGNILDFGPVTSPLGPNPNRGVIVRLSSENIAFTKNRDVRTSSPQAFSNVFGSKLDDLIEGNSQNNRIEGGSGNDEIFGLGGDDLLVGDTGDDLLVAGNGQDRLEGGEGKDIVYAGGSGEKALRGGPGDDQLWGGPNDDDLWGAGGADIFVSGGGDDTTDARADVSVVTSSASTVWLGPGNSPVIVPCWAETRNVGEDWANNVKVDNRWSGAVYTTGFVQSLGELLTDPVTGMPTPILVIPPGFAQTDKYQAVASTPGLGTYTATVTIGAPYIKDPVTWNNRSQREITVKANTNPAPVPNVKLKTARADGTKTGNGEVKGLGRDGVSTDGSWIAFYSMATDYDTVPAANITGPLHVYFGDPKLVDVTPDGQSSGNNIATSPSLSADGRYVAFASPASNLVAGATDGNAASDVFVRDMVAGVTRLVSVSTAGNAAGNGASESPKISGDGRYVVFRSQATDLVAGFPAGTTTWQVYRADLQTGGIQLVSVNAAGSVPANGDSATPLVNRDGRYVVWSSAATDLVNGLQDTNGEHDLFVRDMTAGTTALVTINHQRTGTANGLLRSPVEITPDGAFIAYASYATDLVNVADPVAFTSDVFVYDVRQATNRLVSISADGTSAGNKNSSNPVLSDDGRYVAFQSEASNLNATDWGKSVRVYVRDLTLGVTEFGAVTTDGTTPAAMSQSPSLSGDGRYLAFHSAADNLVSGFVDGNTWGGDDVYVRDRQTGKTTLISVNRDGTASGNGESRSAILSRDGQLVYFFSEATDLVAGILDENGAPDLFSSNRHVAEPDTALRYTAPSGGANRVTLRKNGTNLEIVADVGGQVLASRPYVGTTAVVVAGADASDDQLTVDLASGGFFSVPGGVRFSGGAGGHDTLVLRGSVTTVRHDATGTGDGFVTAEAGTVALAIDYTGLEPIVDEVAAADRFFSSWLTGGVQIRLSDDAEPNNGRMVIDAAGTGAFESIVFANPTRLLSLSGGSGNDTLTTVSLDSGFAAQLWLAGGTGNDILDASALSRAVTLDGGPGDDTLRGGGGDTRYNVMPGSRDVLHDSGGTDTLAFSAAFDAVTVDLDLQGVDQTIDAGGNQLQINGQIENFVGGAYADVVWAAPLAVPRDVRAGAALSGQTVYDQLRVRTHDPGASNSGFNISVPGFDLIKTGSTFSRVSMWLPPVAVDDHVAAQIGTPLTIPVAANDTDPENDPLAVSSITQPASGTAVLNGDGTVTYTPAAGFFGPDQFTYTIQDLLRGSDTATVYVQVNRPPDAVDDAVTNTIVTVAVLANDTDPDEDILQVTAISQPADGSAVINVNGTITYTPPPGFQGTALIPYTIRDGNGGTDTATVTVTVRPVNDPPNFTVGTNQTVDANAGPQTVAGWATNIAAGPPDEAGQSVSFLTATDNAALFAVGPAIASNGTLTYTPAAGISGTAVVLVQAVDDGGTADGGSDASEIVAFTITVLAQRDIELLGFGTAAGAFSQLALTYTIHGAAVPAFEIALVSSANARFDAGDTERGPRVSVTDAALRAVGTHTVTVSGAAYEAFLLDAAVPFFLAVADVGQAIPDETNETNNDLNFLGLYHRPASPAPLLIRGGDDTDRRVDDANDTIELTGGVALNVASRFTAQPLVIPWADVASIRVVAAGGQDTIRADAAALPLLQAEGGTGSDAVVFAGGGIVCDLTGGVQPRMRGVEWLDIRGNGANRVVLRQAQVLDADGGVLHVRAGTDDTVDFGSGWTTAAPQFIGSEFFNVLGQAGASLRLTGPHPWQNPVNALDVNNSGQIAAEDVLLVINLINSGVTGPLALPPTAGACPPQWYDVTGDDAVTAADVLAVINWINGHAAAALAGIGEGEQRPAAEGEDTDRAWAEPFQEAVRSVPPVVESGVGRSVSTTCRRRTPSSLTWPDLPDTQTARAFRVRRASDFVASSTGDDWERSVTDWFREFGGEAPAEWSAGF